VIEDEVVGWKVVQEVVKTIENEHIEIWGIIRELANYGHAFGSDGAIRMRTARGSSDPEALSFLRMPRYDPAPSASIQHTTSAFAFRHPSQSDNKPEVPGDP
jgi:hypothetical protein